MLITNFLLCTAFYIRENIANVVDAKESTTENPPLSSLCLFSRPGRRIKKAQKELYSTSRFCPATRFLANPWRMKPVFACWWQIDTHVYPIRATYIHPLEAYRRGVSCHTSIPSLTDEWPDATSTTPHFLTCHFSNRSFVVGIRCAIYRRIEFRELRELSPSIASLKNYDSFQRRSDTPRNICFII